MRASGQPGSSLNLERVPAPELRIPNRPAGFVAKQGRAANLPGQPTRSDGRFPPSSKTRACVSPCPSVHVSGRSLTLAARLPPRLACPPEEQTSGGDPFGCGFLWSSQRCAAGGLGSARPLPACHGLVLEKEKEGKRGQKKRNGTEHRVGRSPGQVRPWKTWQ